MFEPLPSLVTNTTPLIALTAATGNLDVLNLLFSKVIVPLEVAEEIRAGGKTEFGVDVFEHADWLDIQEQVVSLQPFLKNSLDRGEAAVIQTALTMGVPLVCIDEAAGRRVARLCGLDLTGTIGLLIKAKQRGHPVSIPGALERLRKHGIWLSAQVIQFAMAHT